MSSQRGAMVQVVYWRLLARAAGAADLSSRPPPSFRVTPTLDGRDGKGPGISEYCPQ